jgi:endonuclease G, mitochondrial
LGYSEDRRVPLWVVEHLPASRVGLKGNRSHCKFMADASLKTTSHEPAALGDYRNQRDQSNRRYDRGHMAPAADMAWSPQAVGERCLLSNIAPQQGVGMNQAIWADLERLVRDWACSFKEVYVVTGPIYEQDPPNTLGPNGIHVPTSFYKVVYVPEGPILGKPTVVAFVIENVAIDKGGDSTPTVLSRHRVSVESIEQRTGLRFFAPFPAREQARLKSSTFNMLKVSHACKQGRGGRVAAP